MINNIFYYLQMDCIAIPLLRGSLDDCVGQGGEIDSNTPSTSANAVVDKETK